MKRLLGTIKFFRRLAILILLGSAALSGQAQTNGIFREVYTGITGASVADLVYRPNFPTNPTTVEVLNQFEAPTNAGINYGQRLSAFITAPNSGDYTFSIASADSSELYLSTDDQPAHKRLIASVPGLTDPHEWLKYPEQQSDTIYMEGGQRYYIEALMKQSTNTDNLAVKWQFPDNTVEEPIPASRLQVFRSPSPDSVTLRPGGKVKIPVTANDLGYFTNQVEIVTPPALGTAIANNDGTVLYANTNGYAASDTFTYRLNGPGGLPSAPATVTVNFSTGARISSGFTTFPAQAPVSNQWQLVDAFPGLGFNSPNTMCAAPGDPYKLFLIESAGRVWLIPDVTAAIPSKTLFLDIQDRVLSDHFERGAKGVACHPGFSTNGFIFVTYNCNTNGFVRARLSRFTRSTTNASQADPSTELVLIDQIDQGPYHDIDTCRFGPDGYLYVALGDEGGPSADYTNAQVIDKNLYSCIARIDVDKRPGNLEPNPNPNIPRDPNGLAHYSVPTDNPFVGVTNFNGQQLIANQVRTEMYVVGLRNPWQFSFDPGTNRLWIGDVGNNAVEKVLRFSPGQNAGWPFVEGLFIDDFDVMHSNYWQAPSDYLVRGAYVTNATITTPWFEYWHGTATNHGDCITGGFLYQGTNYPGLDGKYIFGDFYTGSIWNIDPDNAWNTFTRMTGSSAPVAFQIDPANNDILVLHWAPDGSNNGKIMRLVFSKSTGYFPQKLSDTGFFADLNDLTPNPGAEHYIPNLRFWSDYADKTRWFVMPDATNTMTYASDTNWTFPAGIIFAKHFDLDLERGNPATAKRIETRFLVKTTNGAYGVSYRWNDAGTEAYLEPDSGEDFDLTVTNSGVAKIQHYHVPSRSECLTCHNPAAGSILSFNSRQLNQTGTIDGVTSNQLALLAADGYLTGLNQNPASLPRFYRANETNFSLDARVRSYLAVNCSYCHSPTGSAPPSWNARPQLTLSQTRLINGLPLANGLNAADRLVVPGDPNHSVVWLRVGRTNGLSTMPPLASNEQDAEDLQLISDWISNLTAPTAYDLWRQGQFGDLDSPEGEPTADPDGDGLSNYAEFLEYSDPWDDQDSYHAAINITGGQITFQIPAWAGRRLTVETSTDMGISDPWTIWPVVGNPCTSGTANVLSGPCTDTQRYFRLRVESQ